MRRRTSLSIVVALFPIVVWPSFVAPFQLPWLHRSNYDRKKDTVVCPLLRHSNYDRKKKIQLSVHHSLRSSNCHCCAVPITTRKKRYSRLSVVTPFQLRPEKKKIQSSGHHLLHRSNCHCCAFPITTGRKKKVQSSVHCYAAPITTGKKDTVVWPSFVAPFQLPLFCRSNYNQKKKIQWSVHCYAVPITN